MVPQNSTIIRVEKEEGAAVSCGGKVIFKNKGGDDGDQGCNSIDIICRFRTWPVLFGVLEIYQIAHLKSLLTSLLIFSVLEKLNL